MPKKKQKTERKQKSRVLDVKPKIEIQNKIRENEKLQNAIKQQ